MFESSDESPKAHPVQLEDVAGGLEKHQKSEQWLLTGLWLIQYRKAFMDVFFEQISDMIVSSLKDAKPIESCCADYARALFKMLRGKCIENRITVHNQIHRFISENSKSWKSYIGDDWYTQQVITLLFLWEHPFIVSEISNYGVADQYGTILPYNQYSRDKIEENMSTRVGVIEKLLGSAPGDDDTRVRFKTAVALIWSKISKQYNEVRPAYPLTGRPSRVDLPESMWSVVYDERDHGHRVWLVLMHLIHACELIEGSLDCSTYWDNRKATYELLPDTKDAKVHQKYTLQYFMAQKEWFFTQVGGGVAALIEYLKRPSHSDLDVLQARLAKQNLLLLLFNIQGPLARIIEKGYDVWDESGDLRIDLEKMARCNTENTRQLLIDLLIQRIDWLKERVEELAKREDNSDVTLFAKAVLCLWHEIFRRHLRFLDCNSHAKYSKTWNRLCEYHLEVDPPEPTVLDRLRRFLREKAGDFRTLAGVGAFAITLVV